MPHPGNFQVTVQAALERGIELKSRVEAHLCANPPAAGCDTLLDDVSCWFNVVTVDILPYTAYDHPYISTLMQKVMACIHDDVAAAGQAMSNALRIVRTAASGVANTAGQLPATKHLVHNTAFILMWMDPERPELEDVYHVAKSVFWEFGIDARRADKIQQSTRITDLVLNWIRRAEFVFADLTGERPNVYYEVGYAHAIGKEPLLFRRDGTRLHFDLALHNVPKYRNTTHLGELLRERLRDLRGETEAAMTRMHEAQHDLVRYARERLYAAAMDHDQDLADAIHSAPLVLSSYGFYEMRIENEDTFQKLQSVIKTIADEAKVGWVNVYCPALWRV